MSLAYKYKWVLGTKLWSSHFRCEHVIHWATSPAPHSPLLKWGYWDTGKEGTGTLQCFYCSEVKSKSFHLTKQIATVWNDSSLGMNSLITDNKSSLRFCITKSEVAACPDQFLHTCVYAISMHAHTWEHVCINSSVCIIQVCISTA